MKAKTKAGARFDGVLDAVTATQIRKLSANQRKARGILKALGDARAALERERAAVEAHAVRGAEYESQIDELETALAEIPEDEAAEG